MRTALIIVLALTTLFVNESNAQRSKKNAKRTADRIAVRKPGRGTPESSIERDLPVMRQMAVPANGRVSHQDVAIVQTPEPLIGIHYLLEYPKPAQEGNLEASIRFFATVKGGVVTNVVLQGDADAAFMDAVREAASKLRFDASWHTPDKQEFVYTKEVSFKLPDTISLRP